MVYMRYYFRGEVYDDINIIIGGVNEDIDIILGGIII